jgi:hypothetical protein
VAKNFFQALPPKIKQIDKFGKFKSELKKYLKDNCFYNIDEYIAKSNSLPNSLPQNSDLT